MTTTVAGWEDLIREANPNWNFYLNADASDQTFIRVRLSRPLYWAEREALRGILEDLGVREGVVVDWEYVHKNPRKDPELLLKAYMDSRVLFEEVQRVLGTEFTNVYVKSVRTFNES